LYLLHAELLSLPAFSVSHHPSENIIICSSSNIYLVYYQYWRQLCCLFTHSCV